MKLSIIVPVYNLERYISITLDSLLSIRVSFDYEIVIINDGSTDKSEEVIKEYREKFRNIRLFTIVNNGVSNARNFGISQAKGKYITFVDGDDTVNPDFFEIAVQELEIGGYDFVQGNFETIKGNEISLCQYVDRDFVIDDIYKMYECFFLPHKKLIHNTVWGKVYKTELLKNEKFDTVLKVAEDQKYIFDLLTKVKKIKLLRVIGITYVQRESSAMHTFNEKKIKDKIIVINYCKDKVIYPEIKTYIDWYMLDALIELYRFYIRCENELSDSIYKNICEIENKKIKKYNSKKTNILLWVLIHLRWLYKTYVKHKGR